MVLRVVVFYHHAQFRLLVLGAASSAAFIASVCLFVLGTFSYLQCSRSYYGDSDAAPHAFDFQYIFACKLSYDACPLLAIQVEIFSQFFSG